MRLGMLGAVCVTAAMDLCGCARRDRSFTRGQRVTKQSMHEFVASLHELPEDARAELLALTPMNYVGLAPQLARGVASRD